MYAFVQLRNCAYENSLKTYLFNSAVNIESFFIDRMTTCLENPEMSGILTAIGEMSGILLKVREVSGKNLVWE